MDLQKLINEIKLCAQNDCYTVALLSALALPDLCGQAEYPELRGEKHAGERYKKWYQEYLGQYEDSGEGMPYPSADVVYDLRCSLMHSLIPEVKTEKRNLADFKLAVDGSWMNGGLAFRGSNGNRGLTINAKNLIWKLCRVASYYYKDNKDKFDFLSNVEIAY